MCLSFPNGSILIHDRTHLMKKKARTQQGFIPTEVDEHRVQ